MTHFKNTATSAHFAATLASTGTAIIFGHPWDTVSKRLQVTTGKVNWSVFRQAIRQPYTGIGWAAGYKAVQWGGKLAAFKPVKSSMHGHLSEPLSAAFGTTKGEYAVAMMSGAVVGALEACVVLPTDSMKVIKQTNPGVIQGNSMRFFINHYFMLYRGLTATIARNAPGSALLLGGSDIGRQLALAENHSDKLSLSQNIIISSFSSLASIVGTYPIDLVKTRMQSSFGAKQGVIATMKKIQQADGFIGFWRGILPKALATVPKLTLQLAVFQKALDFFQHKETCLENSSACANRGGI